MMDGQQIDPVISFLQSGGAGAPVASGGPDAIESFLQNGGNTSSPPEGSDPSLAQNILNDWKGHAGNIIKSQVYGATGQQSTPETGLQNMGDIAGAAWDVPTEIAKSAWGDKPQKIADSIDNTSAGQKIGDLLMQGKATASDIAQQYPRATRNAQALANVLGMGGAPDAAEVALKPVNAVGDALYESGNAAKDAADGKFIQDLVLPKETAAVKTDMALRTKQIDGTNIYQPTSHEQQMAEAVSNIPGVGKSNSLQKNLNIIQDANQQEAQALKVRLQANDAPISDDTIINTLSDVRKNLANNPYISGVDGAKAADNVVNKALDIISSKPQTASSMLDARKELDEFVSSQKGDKTFNPALDSPISTAVQKVRQAMNNMVAQAVPEADVLASLQKQSHFYQAADNIAPKAAGEAATRLGRLIQTVTPHNFKEAGAGVGGFAAAGAAMHYLPMSVIAPALAGYGVYKGAMSPATRMAIGKAMGGGQ